MRIKNWKKFQHFKDRRPPWIKLHREIMDQRDIMMISSCNFKILVCLWLLASEDETCQGYLPNISDISFRLRMSQEEIYKALQELTDFIEIDDINVISERYQDGPPETETETETETEKKKKIKKKKKLTENDFDLDSLWRAYPVTRKNRSKGSKQLFKEKIIKNLNEGESYEEIRDGIGRYAEFCNQTGEYNKNGEVFIHNRLWLDDWSIPEATGSGNGVARPEQTTGKLRPFTPGELLLAGQEAIEAGKRDSGQRRDSEHLRVMELLQSE